MMTKVSLSIKQALAQLRRNLAMSAASLFSITAIMIVLGVLFIIIVNVNNMAESVKQDFDTIQLNLKDSVSRERADELANQITSLDEVDSVTYLTREEAMENWKEKWGANRNLLDRMKTNPLPNALIVKVLRLEDADIVYNYVKDMPEMDTINYYKDTVKKLLAITNVVQLSALIIIIFMIIISIIVVSNTIKLTVIARGKEIMIMKYIGATNWFIRAPFLIEGIIIGIISACIAQGLVMILYNMLVENYGRKIMLILSTGLVPMDLLMSNLFVIFLALGVSIGACGSVISMRRFLDK